MTPDRQLSILHAHCFPRCTAVVDKHFDGYCCVQFMESGKLRLAYDSNVHHLEGMWFWFTMPGPRIRFTTADGSPWHHRYIAFRGPLVDWWQRQRLIHRQPIPCPISEHIRFAWLFDEILGRLGGDGKWARVKTVNLLENLLIDIENLRHPVRRAKKSSRLVQIVSDAWKASPNEQVDYEKLARRYGLAHSTFRRRFFQETGVAVHRFVIRLRIERARQLLIESDLTVEQIADSLGFSDVFYFTRCFKKVVGLPPAHYRHTRLHAPPASASRPGRQ